MKTITQAVDDVLARHPDWTVALSRDPENRRWKTEVLDRSTGRGVTTYVSDLEMAQARGDLRVVVLDGIEKQLALGPLEY